MIDGDDSLAFVLAMAFENGFSPFPELSDQSFGGLITENAVMRWLVRRVAAQSAKINLEFVTVKTVPKEQDLFLGGIPICYSEA